MDELLAENIVCGNIVIESSDLHSVSSNAMYYGRFRNNDGSITYRVEIIKEDWTGANTEIVNMTDEPLVYKHIDVEGTHIQGSEVQFKFIADRADYADFDTLTEGDDFEYWMKIFDESDDRLPVWWGFIIPSQISRSYFAPQSTYTLVATDYLTKLKDFTLQDKDGNIPQTRKTISQVLAWCLNNLIYSNGAVIQSSVKEANMDWGLAFGRAYVFPKIFQKTKNGLMVPDNAYDVLDNILKMFNSRICSPLMSKDDFPSETNGRLWISNSDEVISPAYETRYSNSYDGLVSYKTTNDNDISVNIDNYKFGVDSELSKKVPLKSMEILMHNYDTGEEADTVDFSMITTLTIWTRLNLTYLTFLNNRYNFQVGTLTTGTLTITNAFNITNVNNNKYINVSFTFLNTTAYVAQSTPTLNDISNGIFVFVNIIKTSSRPYTRTEFVTKLNQGRPITWKSPKNEVFKVHENGGDYKVEISFVNPSNSRIKTFSLWDVAISVDYENTDSIDNVIFDSLFAAQVQDNLDATIKIETKIGDSDDARNGSAITLDEAGTILTYDWARYGITESKRLHELVFQSYFNRFGGDSKQLRLSVYDPQNTIGLHKKIDFDDKFYQILDIEKSIKSGWVSLRIQQLSTYDVSFSSEKLSVSQVASTVNENRATKAPDPVSQSHQHENYTKSAAENTFEASQTIIGSLLLNDANTEIKEGTNNSIRLKTNNGYADIGAQNSSYCHMYTDMPSWYSNKDINASDFVLTSDERFKIKIGDVKGVLDKLMNLNPIFFKWNEKAKLVDRYKEGKDIGLIAQELEKVFPELVHTNDDKMHSKGISYSKLSIVNLAAIQELYKLVLKLIKEK